MLNRMQTESENRVTIVGVLKELEIESKQTKDGREYVTGKALIKVDQEINGKMTENEVPVRMFSMKLKSDKTPNAVYEGIMKMKDDYISLAAAETPSQASRVAITSGKIEENNWIDKTTGMPRSSFQISSNFMRKAKDNDEECAGFDLSGVVVKTRREVKNDEETGRLLVTLVTIGYKGKAEVIELVAESPAAAAHIESNWNEGDTVKITGAINMTYSVTEKEVSLGFGAPKKERKTESRKELIILGGSEYGLDEDYSYDADDIKVALDERKQRIDALSAPKAVAPANKATGFGF